MEMIHGHTLIGRNGIEMFVLHHYRFHATGRTAAMNMTCDSIERDHGYVWSSKTVWPSGLRRWLQAPVRKGVGSNPTAVSQYLSFAF